MNCILICIFYQPKYFELCQLLLESLYIYGNLKDDTSIVIYTTTDIMKLIEESPFYTNKILFEINNEYIETRDNSKPILDILTFTSITKLFNKILYLNTNILIRGNINIIFDAFIKDGIIYNLSEDPTDENSNLLYNNNFLTSEILLFNNSQKTIDIFESKYDNNNTEDNIDNNIEDKNAIDNKLLQQFVIDNKNDYLNYNSKCIVQFSEYLHSLTSKIKNMKKYLNNLKIIYDVIKPPLPNIKLPLIGICTCYSYFDILKFTLPVNYLHFEKIYLITQLDDIETLNFCKKFQNVEILFYDFNNNNYFFDKYGAIKYAQEIAYKEYPDNWYLIIDSDIVLPNNFIDILINEKLNEECIYGANRLNIYKTSEIFQKRLLYSRIKVSQNNILRRKHHPPSILGSFQLYKKKCYQPDNFIKFGWEDCFFGYNNFNIFCQLNNLIVIHLGESTKNWNFIHLPFTIDCNVEVNNFYFNCEIKTKNTYYNENGVIIDNYVINNDSNLICTNEFRRDIVNFFWDEEVLKIAEFGNYKCGTTKYLSRIFSEVYSIEKNIDFINFNKDSNLDATNIEYINLDLDTYSDDFTILPLDDIDVLFLDANYSYINFKNDILVLLTKFKNLKFIIFGHYDNLFNNNLIINELSNINYLIFERFIGVKCFFPDTRHNEGVIYRVNTNVEIEININSNTNNISLKKIKTNYIDNNINNDCNNKINDLINSINNINNIIVHNETNKTVETNKTNKNNIIAINLLENNTYSWGMTSITFLNNGNIRSPFYKGRYIRINEFILTAKIDKKEYRIVFNNDYTQFTAKRKNDKESIKGSVLLSDKIIENKTYSWGNSSITFLNNGKIKKTKDNIGFYKQIHPFKFQVNLNNNDNSDEYIVVFNNDYTKFTAKKKGKENIIGNILLMDNKILEEKTYSWDKKSITFLENGKFNSSFGNGTYRQINYVNFILNCNNKSYNLLFDSNYIQFTARHSEQTEIIKGSIILNPTILEGKSYSWKNNQITFLKDNQINGFGKGFYSQIDYFTFNATIRGKPYILSFNKKYTEFTSALKNDLAIVGNDNKMISDSRIIEDKTYSLDKSSFTFFKKKQIITETKQKGNYNQIDQFIFDINICKKQFKILFNNDFTEFTTKVIRNNKDVIIKYHLLNK